MNGDESKVKKVIEQIRKLMNFSDGNASEAEVANAMAIAQELLEKYQLSISDIEKQEIGEEIVTEYIDPEFHVTRPWQRELIRAIVKPLCGRHFTQQEDWSEWGWKNYVRTVKVVGYYSDVQLIKYLWSYIPKVLMDMADAAGREQGFYHHELAMYKNSFMIAAAEVIRDRLERRKHGMTEKEAQALKDLQEAARLKRMGKGKALVIMKEENVDEYMEKNFVLYYLSYSTRDTGWGTDDGKEAGSKIHLGAGVNSGTHSKLKIGSGK